MLDSVGHIRLDDDYSSIEEMETIMAKTIKAIVTIDLGDDDIRDASELIEQIDGAVSDHIDGWYSVDVEQAEERPAGMRKSFAERAYVEQVEAALEYHTPNAPEEWDDESIQELANYLLANDHIEVDMYNMSEMYTMYDLLKWTRANNA